MASMIKKMSFAGTHMQVLHHPHPSRKRKKSQAVKPRIGSQNDSQRFRFLASLNVTRYEMEKTTEEIHDHEKEIHSIARKGSIARHILKSNKESVQDVLDVLESRCASKLTSRQSSARRVAFYNSLNVEDSPKSQRPDTIYAYRSNWSRSPLLELRGKESKSTKLRAVNQIDILEDLKQASFSRRIKRLMEAEKNAKLKETARKSSNKLFQKSEDDSKRQIEKFRRVVTSVIDINTGFGKILETRRHLAEERRKREEFHTKPKIHSVFNLALHVIKLSKAMIHHSCNITTKTATMEAWHHLENSGESAVFSRDTFAADIKNYSYVPIWAKSIFNKKPEERTHYHISSLHSLLRGLESFEKFTFQIQMAMCKTFTYIKLKKNRVVLRKGHMGVNFYFIFSGSVFVNIEEYHKKTGKNVWRTTTVLGRGECFGEVALLRRAERTATVVIREDVELLAVDRETFVDVCPEMLDQELKVKVAFCRNLSFFEPWSDSNIQDICFDSRVRYYESNKLVIGDSQREKDWLYLCMEGKCMVVKALELNPRQDELKLTMEDLSSNMERVSVTNSEQSSSSPSQGSILENSMEDPHHLSGMPIELKKLLAKRRKSDIPGEDSSSDEEDRCGDVKSANKKKFLRNGQKVLKNLSFQLKSGNYSDLDDKSDETRDENDKVVTNNTLHLTKPICRPSDVLNNRKCPMSIKSIVDEMKAKNPKLTFLCIGYLTPGEIFDAVNFLQDETVTEENPQSYTLVSLGAKMLKVKRLKFFKYASKEGLEHAKRIAEKSSYSSDDEIRQAYIAQKEWERYKKMTMANTLYQAALARPKTVSAHAFQEKEKIKKMKVKRDFNSNRSAFIYDTETASRTQSRQSNLSRKITERSCSPDSNKTPFISVKLVN